VAEDAGIGKADVPREPALTRVTTTPDAGDDPLAGAMPDEALWFTDVRVSWEVSAGATVLARDPAGTPVLLARSPSYAVTLRPDLDGDAIIALLGEDSVTSRQRPFLRAYGAALIGRWVDLVVGRTEAEQPWAAGGHHRCPVRVSCSTPLTALVAIESHLLHVASAGLNTTGRMDLPVGS
jgi:hypothetical protein